MLLRSHYSEGLSPKFSSLQPTLHCHVGVGSNAENQDWEFRYIGPGLARAKLSKGVKVASAVSQKDHCSVTDSSQDMEAT